MLFGEERNLIGRIRYLTIHSVRCESLRDSRSKAPYVWWMKAKLEYRSL